MKASFTSITQLMGLAFGGTRAEPGLNKLLTPPDRLWDKGPAESAELMVVS